MHFLRGERQSVFRRTFVPTKFGRKEVYYWRSTIAARLVIAGSRRVAVNAKDDKNGSARCNLIQHAPVITVSILSLFTFAEHLERAFAKFDAG